MKRNISIILVICFIVMLIPVSAFAENTDAKGFDKGLPKNLKVIDVGHGEYTVQGKSDIKGKVEIANIVDGQEVYQLKDGTYLAYINDTTLLRVNKITVQLIDKKAIEDLFANYSFDNAVINEINTRSDKAIEAGNKDASVTLYTASAPKQTNEVSPMATQTSYYYYHGCTYKTDLIYYTTLQTTWRDVVKGVTAADASKSIVNLAIVGAGCISGPIGTAVSLFSSGVSVWTEFSNLIGHSPICGQYDDKVQVNIRYDINTKYTYKDYAGTYLLGAVTQSVYIHNIQTYEYFVTSDGGKESYNPIRYVYETYKTPNFDAPWVKAEYWAGDPWTEYVNWYIYGQPVYF